jgi:hypothetical protein
MKSLGLKLRSEPLRRHLIVSSGRFYQRAIFSGMEVSGNRLDLA